MKSKKKQIILLFVILLAIPVVNGYLSTVKIASVNNINPSNDLGTLKTSTTYTDNIIIEDDNPLLDWANRSAEGICTGSGTSGDPYVISNDVINTADPYGFLIRDSRKFFKILSSL